LSGSCKRSNAWKIWVRKPEGKRLFGIPRHSLEDNRIFLTEIGFYNNSCGCGDRLLCPSGFANLWEF
jgi:hypothetical protein